MFLDIHALQTMPYSNVNRDGLGSPKSCVYGGAQRIRVSSQSWKRAARMELEDRIGEPTVRTRQIAVRVQNALIDKGWEFDDARRAGRAIVQAYSLAPDAESDITSVLLWLPASVLEDLVALAAEHRELIQSLALPELGDNGKPKRVSKEKQEENKAAMKTTLSAMSGPVAEILNRTAPTINLLGRMLADTPDHTVDGATAVAHAFTVHEAAPDFDYFTAVDDFAPNSGAAHLSTAEFATGTFYRYCTINIDQFAAALGDLNTALEVVHAWTRTFLTVMPSGKQHSTAAYTYPDLVYLAVRQAPMSLASGFEKPIRTGGDGYLGASVAALSDYTERLHRFLGDHGSWSGHAGTVATETSALGTSYGSLDELIEQSNNALREAEPKTVNA